MIGLKEKETLGELICSLYNGRLVPELISELSSISVFRYNVFTRIQKTEFAKVSKKFMQMCRPKSNTYSYDNAEYFQAKGKMFGECDNAILNEIYRKIQEESYGLDDIIRAVDVFITQAEAAETVDDFNSLVKVWEEAFSILHTTIRDDITFLNEEYDEKKYAAIFLLHISSL